MKKSEFNIFPEMNKEDRAMLKSELDTNGYDSTMPVYLYKGDVLDGWNRCQICKELKIEPIYANFTGTDMDAINFCLRTNKRRNLNSGQWACIAVEAKDVVSKIKEAVEEARRLKQAKTQSKDEAISQLIDTQPKLPNKNRADQKTAELFNTNRTYVSDAAKLQTTSPENFQKVKSGEKTLTEIKKAEKMVARRASIEEKVNNIASVKVKQAEGTYDVVVIDPPWAMEKIERDVRPNQTGFDYPTMSEEELEKLDIPSADDCHVWLWTTHKFLPMAFRLLEKWGLKYVCTFTWHKPGGFQPFGLPQYNCEFALYARKGTPAFVDTKALPTCFNAPRGAHSEKPEEFYDTIKRVTVTTGRKIDMFSRRDIEGFDNWGNQASSNEGE